MDGRSQQPDWPMTSIAEFQPHNNQFLTGMLTLTLLSDRMLCGLVAFVGNDSMLPILN